MSVRGFFSRIFGRFTGKYGQQQGHSPDMHDSVATWGQSIKPDKGRTHPADKIRGEVRKHRHSV